MRSTTSNMTDTNLIHRLIKKGASGTKQAVHWLTLGITVRQWLASALISTMLSSLFVLPVQAAMAVNATLATDVQSNYGGVFEPVNASQWFWKEALTSLSAKIELWRTPMREINVKYAADSSDSNEESVDESPKLIKEKAAKSIDGKKIGKIKDKNIGGKIHDGNAAFIDKIGASENIKPAAETREFSLDGMLSAVSGINLPENILPKAKLDPTPSPTPSVEYIMPGAIISGGNELNQLNNAAPPDEDPGGGSGGNSPSSIWNKNLWNSLFTPENNLGSPSGQSSAGYVAPGVAGRTRERTGTSNFSFDVPVCSLPGRGLNSSVGITYNSQLWNKSQTENTSNYTYSVDRNWLAPGFNLGFGYMDKYYDGSNNYFSITSPDGTRHELFYKGTEPYGYWNLYESADGEFIQMTYPIGPVLGGLNNLWVKFPDGSAVSYGGPGGERWYAREIIDRNGNYVSISYLEGEHNGRINKITDMLNREIIFHYDDNADVSKKKLVAISVPGYGANPRRQVIRFYYEDIAFQPRFDGTAGVFGETTMPTTINVLKYIYFPGTKTGYKYDYSPIFGMIYKITEFAGMQVSDPSNLTVTGTVSNDGQWVNSTQYNYPVNPTDIPTGVLTDIPKYNQRTDDWQGRNSSTPYTNTYQVTENSTTKERIIRVILPDGNTSETKLNLKPAETVNGVWTTYWDNGLTKETSLLDANGTLLQKQIFTWQQGVEVNGRKNPRIDKIESINELGQSTAVTYSSYDNFNNPGVVTEYGFADSGGNRAELRRTETTYVTGAGWLESRLIRLPLEVKRIVNNEVVSKVVYEYDDSPNLPSQHNAPPPNVINRADAVHHEFSYNPFVNHDITTCYNGQCVTVIVDYPQVCYKGNVTKVTAYSNAALQNDPNASVTAYKYDMLGNAVEATLNCCNLKTWEYTNGNQYAYPLTETKGMDVQLVARAEYDYNTGLVTRTKDENDQPTDYEYEIDTLRPKKTIYANGGYVLTEYSDKLVSNPVDMVPGFVRQTTTLEANKTVQSYNYFDGRGAAIRTATATPDGWSVAAIEYDSLGRASKSYNPFYAAAPNGSVPAGTKYTQVTNYDALGRTTQVQLQDATVINSYPNEAAVSYTDADNQTRTGTASRAVDQAGKQRRQVVDALGRVVRVDEPDTLGNGLGSLTAPVQPTFYNYDGNDNLTKVVQIDGNTRQERVFRYDSLSRLTNEKQVEASATLNDAGVKVTSGGLWTKVLKYDSHGLLTDGFDARGVNTHFGYDGLNRVQSVTFSDGTPQVTYTYDQARSGFYNTGALTRVETADGGTARPDTPATSTEFDYDKMGRVVAHRNSIGTQVYSLGYNYNLAGQLTSETYPSGKVVTNSYDTGGRLAGITSGARTFLSSLQYQGTGTSLSSMTLGNGTTQSFTMNDRLQMTNQTLAKNSEILQKYDYGYGQIDSSENLDTSKNNGQLGQIESYIGTSKQWTQKFSYDAIGRLAQAAEYRGDNSALSYKQVFDYDRFGNLYRKNSSNPTAGQATPLPFTPIEDADIGKSTNRFTSGTSYDDAGNVITDSKFRDMNFSYDANGRMFKTLSTDNLHQSSAVYDASGQRVAQQVDNEWQFFIYDIGGKKVAEYGGTQAQDEGGIRYVFSDWQGSTRLITGEGGAIQARMDYTAFGEEIYSGVGQRTTQQGFNASNNLNNKYALTERDKATGLDHTWFRKLENQAGRWTSPDPYNGSMSLSDPQSFNRYAYVNNQPTNFVDPSGLLMVFFQRCHYENDKKVCEVWGWSTNGGGSSGGVEGGGGGRGGGAGPGVESKEKSSCSITIRGKGSPDKRDKLSFLNKIDQPAVLGPWSGELTGNLYQVEISGKVSGTSNFTFGQTKNTTAGLFDSVTSTYIPIKSVGLDIILPQDQQIDRKTGLFFVVDAPGLLVHETTKYNAYIEGNFTSYIEVNKERLCQVDWHVRIHKYNGETTYEFGLGHFK